LGRLEASQESDEPSLTRLMSSSLTDFRRAHLSPPKKKEKEKERKGKEKEKKLKLLF